VRRSEGRGLHAVEGVYQANTSGQLGVLGARAIVCPVKQDIIVRTSRVSLSLSFSFSLLPSLFYKIP